MSATRNQVTRMTRNELSFRAHQNAVNKGFWAIRRSTEHYIMLVQTEICELVQADRKGKTFSKVNELLYKDIINPKTPTKGATDKWEDTFEMFLESTVPVELADVVIRLADLAGSLGVDFNKLNPCNYIRDFAKFEVTENALGLVKGLVRNDICIERRILWAMNYCFGWAEAMGIDLWFYIEEKMKYNESRPALHNRRY